MSAKKGIYKGVHSVQDIRRAMNLVALLLNLFLISVETRPRSSNMAKAQEELGKMFKTFSSDFDNEQLDKFIKDSERIMRRPAEMLLKQAGLDASTNTPFALLDHACGTGPIAAHLQASVDKGVLSRGKMLCADISANLVDTLKRRAEKHKWVNVETAILDAQVYCRLLHVMKLDLTAAIELRPPCVLFLPCHDELRHACDSGPGSCLER